ncbi:hypothetical protein DPMN_139956 [Dreissena polymorpha]|uniref:Uncharacterized protein n=1 Tax=Dreissena polymorpha TaxID=45954 RepID=A0A9D4G6U1_DREPO|nr:hypothetical protein DPMN_139956 [Dreissena polymorpha]
MKCLFCRQSAELSETKCVNEHIVLNKNCIEYCSDTERTTLKLESDIGDNSTSVTSTSVSALTSGIKVISADSHDEDGRTIACIAKNGTSGEQDVKTNVDHCQVDDVTETLTSI